MGQRKFKRTLIAAVLMVSLISGLSFVSSFAVTQEEYDAAHAAAREAAEATEAKKAEAKEAAKKAAAATKDLEAAEARLNSLTAQVESKRAEIADTKVKMEKKEQEIASLIRIPDSFKKIVVVKDYVKPWKDENGIQYIGVEDFLLDERLISQ